MHNLHGIGTNGLGGTLAMDVSFSARVSKFRGEGGLRRGRNKHAFSRRRPDFLSRQAVNGTTRIPVAWLGDGTVHKVNGGVLGGLARGRHREAAFCPVDFRPRFQSFFGALHQFPAPAGGQTGGPKSALDL